MPRALEILAIITFTLFALCHAAFGQTAPLASGPKISDSERADLTFKALKITTLERDLSELRARYTELQGQLSQLQREYETSVKKLRETAKVSDTCVFKLDSGTWLCPEAEKK